MVMAQASDKSSVRDRHLPGGRLESLANRFHDLRRSSRAKEARALARDEVSGLPSLRHGDLQHLPITTLDRDTTRGKSET